jgi:hypothetical protein
MRILFAFLFVLIGSVAAQPAFAQGHGHGGYGHGGYGYGHGGYGRGYYGYYGYGYPFLAGAVVGGALLAGYPYYYPPYASYYPPYAPYYPAAPTAYVEQPVQPQAQQQPQLAFWYYCAGSNAYYPYVKECPAGWQRVAPQPGG